MSSKKENRVKAPSDVQSLESHLPHTLFPRKLLAAVPLKTESKARQREVVGVPNQEMQHRRERKSSTGGSQSQWRMKLGKHHQGGAGPDNWERVSE